ncbi:MAG: hypothetical protein O2877_03095 [bacterium]|nr:hypothetical protein [bacterium]
MLETVGHEKILAFFDHLFSSGSFHHAYLFVGPTHVGKTHVCQQLAANLLDCTQKQLETHPDFVRLVRENNEKTGKERTVITVDQVRDLKGRLGMSSLAGGYHVAFIEDAEYLTIEGSNALLKLLEDAPKKTIVFLRATDTHHLPDTIVSRSQVFRFNAVSNEVIEKALIKLGASKEEAVDLSGIAAGRPGKAIHLLRDRSAYKKHQDHLAMFGKAISGTVVDRMQLAANLVPKTSESAISESFEILNIWESAMRGKMLEGLSSKTTQIWTEHLSRLDESRQGLRSHLPPQLIFEHILLHI